GGVNTNVMTSGIAVAELLRAQYPLDEKSIKSEKDSQVKGLSGKMIKSVLLNIFISLENIPSPTHKMIVILTIISQSYKETQAV
ncbi:MAG: DUF4928 family protein, partial [Oscillospiraceae bacterium]